MAPFGRWSRAYLDCPIYEKDDAKALGARWDPDRREWYVDTITLAYVVRIRADCV